MSDAWVFLVVIAFGVALSAITFVFNSSTPIQVGPIPFFLGALIALVGLIAFVAKIVR